MAKASLALSIVALVFAASTLALVVLSFVLKRKSYFDCD